MKLDAALRDLLIERGATEAEIKYLEHSDSVSELLSWSSWRTDEGDCICCDGGNVHNRDCKVFAAWYALGMGEAKVALYAAHEAATQEHSRRGNKVPGLSDFGSAVYELERRRFAYMSKLLEAHMYRGGGIASDLVDASLYAQSNMPKTVAGRVQMLNDIVGLNAQLGEQTPLNDAPAVDDGNGLDVDDP